MNLQQFNIKSLIQAQFLGRKLFSSTRLLFQILGKDYI